jgi:hypothetical protein
MYTVNILSEEDFDALPYKHVKTSLGLADPATNTAYVRDTGYNDITKDTIAHELDELMAKTSPHEEDGIRYKNLKSLGAGAGAGLLSSFVPALKPFSPAISAGAGALAADKGERLRGAAQGFGGGGLSSSLGGGLVSAFKGVNQPGGTFGNALKQFVPGVKSGASGFIQGIPGFGRSASGTPTGVLSKFFAGGGGTGGAGAAGSVLASKAGGGSSVPTPGQIGANLLADRLGGQTGANTDILGGLAGRAGSVSSTLNPSKDAGGGVFDKLKELVGGGKDDDTFRKLALGLGIAGAGDLFAPKVDVPDTSGIQSRLAGQVAGGGEPLAKEAGLNELFRILGEPVGAPPASAFDQGDFFADEQLTKDLTALRNEFKAVNPNANVENNSAFLDKKQELIERSRFQRQAARDELSFQHEQEQLGRKFQTMQVALNLDQAQMSQYVQLAQMEIDQLMLQYGIDAQTAANFKEMFSDLGRLAIGQEQSGIDQFFGSLAQQNQGGQS